MVQGGHSANSYEKVSKTVIVGLLIITMSSVFVIFGGIFFSPVKAKVLVSLFLQKVKSVSYQDLERDMRQLLQVRTTGVQRRCRWVGSPETYSGRCFSSSDDIQPFKNG